MIFKTLKIVFQFYVSLETKIDNWDCEFLIFNFQFGIKIKWTKTTRTWPVSFCRFTMLLQGQIGFSFSIYKVLQGQSGLSFSIYKVFTGSNQSPIFDFQCFNCVKWFLLSSIFRDFTCYWHNFWTLFTVYLYDLASRTFTFHRIVSMFYMFCS